MDEQEFMSNLEPAPPMALLLIGALSGALVGFIAGFLLGMG
jgi:hypothetical protein